MTDKTTNLRSELILAGLNEITKTALPISPSAGSPVPAMYPARLLTAISRTRTS